MKFHIGSLVALWLAVQSILVVIEKALSDGRSPTSGDRRVECLATNRTAIEFRVSGQFNHLKRTSINYYIELCFRLLAFPTFS